MTNIESWNDIDWKLVHKTVMKLQIKIFHCSKRNEKARMHLCVLIKLPHAKYLAVSLTAKVTQDNRGRVTAGVDEIKLCGLVPLARPQRLKLAQTLRAGIARKLI